VPSVGLHFVLAKCLPQCWFAMGTTKHPSTAQQTVSAMVAVAGPKVLFGTLLAWCQVGTHIKLDPQEKQTRVISSSVFIRVQFFSAPYSCVPAGGLALA
jgi:hypothetical protein